MQLIDKKDKKLSVGLAMATSALLGQPALASSEGTWQADTAVLFYSESDNRVQAIEPAVNLTRTFADESSVNLRVVYDTLTGASPNGAAPASIPQTFTSASGLARLEQAEEDDDEEHVTEPTIPKVDPIALDRPAPDWLEDVLEDVHAA